MFEELLMRSIFSAPPPPLSTYFLTFQKFQFSCTTMSWCWLKKIVRWKHAKEGNGATKNYVPEELIKKDFESHAFLVNRFLNFYWCYIHRRILRGIWGCLSPSQKRFKPSLWNPTPIKNLKKKTTFLVTVTHWIPTWGLSSPKAGFTICSEQSGNTTSSAYVTQLGFCLQEFTTFSSSHRLSTIVCCASETTLLSRVHPG